jgi:hypothetical protein
MNTAQRVLSGNTSQQNVKTIVPWVVGGLVVAFVLFIIWKIN